MKSFFFCLVSSNEMKERKNLPDTISLSCMLENGGLMIFPLKVR